MALTFALVRNVGYVATMGRAERGEGLVTRGGGVVAGGQQGAGAPVFCSHTPKCL